MDQIAVWMFRAVAPPELTIEYTRLLDAAEAARAQRFVTEALRWRFILARGTLRLLIGKWLGISPRDVVFEYGEHGKPVVAGVQFNLSHSADWVAIAMTADSEVGVDIERIRPIADYVDIARRYFSKAEVEALLALPEQERETAFYRCWTRKEAILKCAGTGFARTSNSFSVTFDHFSDAVVGMDGVPDWNLHGLEAPEGYAAALAYQGVRCAIVQTVLSDIAGLP